MFVFLSFFYGAAIGSFVNVVATRLRVAPILNSRSKCLTCGTTLGVRDLVPVFSYLFLFGKCRTCKTPYGVSNLIVELIFGGIFVLLYVLFLSGQLTLLASGMWLAYYTVLAVVLGVITLYDIKHSYLPTGFLFAFLVLSFGMLIRNVMLGASYSVLLGPITVALPFLLLWLVSRGKWLGGGDVLMFLGVGAFFGAAQGLAVFFVSVWVGLIMSILWASLMKKKLVTRGPIPFVPFIVLAFTIVLFTDIDIFSIVSLFAW